jgi:hypothetical protein
MAALDISKSLESITVDRMKHATGNGTTDVWY